MENNNRAKEKNEGDIKKEINQENSKEFAKEYMKTSYYKDMDKDNKEALQIWAEKGLEASIQHMLKDQKTGNTISYSEVRSKYG